MGRMADIGCGAAPRRPNRRAAAPTGPGTGQRSSAEDLLQRSQRAAGRGDITASDTDARRLAALDSGDRLRTVDRDLTAARLELNRLLGLPPSFAVRLAPAPDHPVPPSTEILVAQAVARRLDLQALRAGYDASEADTRKAILDQFPNLSLTVASARDTAGNVTLGPQIGFTLPLWKSQPGRHRCRPGHTRAASC
jgi:cobalt-zinc-cadmium efflux system outer membrane protein